MRGLEDQRRAGPREVGWAAGLRARHLAGAPPRWSQHPRQAPGADRKAPRSLRASSLAPIPRAPHRRHTAGRSRADGLFLHRPPAGHQGLGVAVHRDRRRLRLHLGTAAHLTAQPQIAPLPSAALPPGHELALAGWKLKTATSDNGSELTEQWASASLVGQLSGAGKGRAKP
jgi:hypothetical protein